MAKFYLLATLCALAVEALKGQLQARETLTLLTYTQGSSVSP